MRKSRTAAIVFGLAALVTLTQCFTEKQDEGLRLYTANCASCHMDDGSGLRGVIPPLAKSDYLQKYRASLPCRIRTGIQGEIIVNGKSYNQAMPAFPELRSDQMTNLLNYIQTNFGNKNERYTMQEVGHQMDTCD
jgi:mono/diheme cytochrome c family protein